MRRRAIAWAFTFAFAFSFLVALRAEAQDAGGEIVLTPGARDAPTVRAVLSTTKVGLGEVFYLFVSVDHPPGVEVNLPAALPLGLELEETARTDRLVKNPAGGLTREFEIALMAFALGPLVLPSVPVTWVAEGRARELAAPALELAVVGALADGEAAALRDIAPPIAVVRRDLTLVSIAGGVAGVLLVALLAWRLLRRRKREDARVAAATEAQRPAHEEALARLDQVEGSGALDADDRKPAYLEMSEIVRAYLGRRYGLPAPELSTAEIRARLIDAAAAEPLVRIVEWLERCDLVKYARGKASEDEARQALYDARIFVERTRDQPAGEGATP